MNSLENVILDILETKQPSNVRELVSLVQEQVDVTIKVIEDEIKSLHKKGLVSLEEPIIHKSFISFLSQKTSLWFWIVIVISVLSFASILFFPAIESPLSYIRYIFAFILVALLPGYSLTETLFPEKSALDLIERITFSIGLSFAITALVGLILSFTPFGLRLATTLSSLGFLVIVLAILALIRKYKIQ
jgi:uncharacterized membrane protein